MNNKMCASSFLIVLAISALSTSIVMAESSQYEECLLKNSTGSHPVISPSAVLFVPFAASPPTLDGSIGSIEWEDAAVNATILMNSTLYFMHDGINVYIGWSVLDSTHSLFPSSPGIRDHLMIYFEEGDDGAFGSGSSDRHLKNNQEDTKYICSGTDLDPTPVRADGYCTGGESWSWFTKPSQIDFNGTMQFYEDNYEAEFAVPFQGVDGRSWDKSDLISTPADVIAFRIRYVEGHTEGGGISAWYDLDFSPLPPSRIGATVDIDPDTLNLKSNGQWMTAYIELPEGYNVSDIDVSSIRLNETFSVDPDAPTQIGDYDSDGVSDLMVKFNRTELTSYLYNIIEARLDAIVLTVSGQLTDGTLFEGSDTVRTRLAGDVNGDAVVDVIDLSMVGRSFGARVDEDRYEEEIDFNGDGIIDMREVIVIGIDYGATIPE